MLFRSEAFNEWQMLWFNHLSGFTGIGEFSTCLEQKMDLLILAHGFLTCKYGVFAEAKCRGGCVGVLRHVLPTRNCN